jgi:hypothetical protein
MVRMPFPSASRAATFILAGASLEQASVEALRCPTSSPVPNGWRGVTGWVGVFCRSDLDTAGYINHAPMVTILDCFAPPTSSPVLSDLRTVNGLAGVFGWGAVFAHWPAFDYGGVGDSFAPRPSRRSERLVRRDRPGRADRRARCGRCALLGPIMCLRLRARRQCERRDRLGRIVNLGATRTNGQAWRCGLQTPIQAAGAPSSPDDAVRVPGAHESVLALEAVAAFGRATAVEPAEQRRRPGKQAKLC